MDLLPSNIDLSAAEVQLVHEVAREQTLQRVLAAGASREYDVILIDCQPSLGLLTVNALTASDGVIVPLECEYFALRGVALLKTTIDKVQRAAQPQARDRRRARHHVRRPHPAQPRGAWSGWSQAWGDTVFHTVIRRTVKFSDSTVAGEPITTLRRRPRPAPTPTASWPRRCWPGVSTSEPAGGRRPVPADRRTRRDRTPDAERGAAGEPDRRAEAGGGTRGPSGRVRHDEKMTVYVTADELLDIEHARLALRREHGLAVDRGRLVREAVAMVLADLEAHGDDSVLVQRLIAGMTPLTVAPATDAPGPTAAPAASRCAWTTSRAPSTCCSA